MTNNYDVETIYSDIPELKGWRLTKGLQLELEDDKFYHVWDPNEDSRHLRLYRGTHSCAWGWGALLAPEKTGVIHTLIGFAYPLIGMAYGLKEKLEQ